MVDGLRAGLARGHLPPTSAVGPLLRFHRRPGRWYNAIPARRPSMELEETPVSTEGPLSASTEEYLEWIYRLSREQEEFTTTDVARSLKVSPASVTGMVKRLAEKGLIHHEKYHGITLSDEGRIRALATIRRHGLLERLLVDVLGLPWHL